MELHWMTMTSVQSESNHELKTLSLKKTLHSSKHKIKRRIECINQSENEGKILMDASPGDSVACTQSQEVLVQDAEIPHHCILHKEEKKKKIKINCQVCVSVKWLDSYI